MEIDLGEFKIRNWTTGDEAALTKYANNRRIWINLRDTFPYPYTEKDARAWIRQATGQTPETSFAIALPEEAIGGIGIRLQEDVFRRTAEIGYWLGEPFWGRGIATRAVKTFSECAFMHFDLARLQAGVFAWNSASARVLEKAGYTCEGRLRKNVIKDEKMTDWLVYARLRT